MADDAGALLVRSGLIADEQLIIARQAQAGNGGTLGEHLVRCGFIDDDTLTEFYRKRLLVPQVDPNDLAGLSARLIRTIPPDMAIEFRVVPVRVDRDQNLTLAMSDPSATHTVDEIAFFTGHYVVRAVATQAQIAWCLAHYYGHLTALGQTLLQPDGGEDDAAAPGDAVPPRRRPGPVTRKVQAERRRAIPPLTAPPINTPRPTADSEPAPEPAPDEDDLFLEIEAEEPPEPIHSFLSDDTNPTGPMQKIPREPTPELEPRAGEMMVGDGRRPNAKNTPLPAVVIDDSPVEPVEDEPASAPIILDRPKSGSEPPPPEHTAAPLPEPGDGDEAPGDEPVVLLNRKKSASGRRRAAKQTRLGIGAVGSNPEMPVRPQPEGSPVRTTTRRVGVGDADDRGDAEDRDEATAPRADDAVPEALPRDAETNRLHRSVSGSIVEAARGAADAAPEPIADDEEARTRKTRVPKKRAVDDSTDRFERLEQPASGDGMDEFGPPGTTIPPPFLGAMPGTEPSVDAGWEIPIPVEDDPSGAVARPPQPSSGAPPEPRLTELPVPDESAASAPARSRADSIPGPSTVAASEGARLSLSDHRDLEDSSLKLVETLRDLDRATSRDQVIDVLLDHIGDGHDRVGFFAVKAGTLSAFRLRRGGSAAPASSASLELDAPSTFQDIIGTRLPFRGPLSDPPSRQLIEAAFGSPADGMLGLPVAVRGRVVGILYGDTPTKRAFEEHLAVVTRAAGVALERILKSRKK